MFITVFLTGIGLAMDAFAVAICKGLKMQKLNYKQMGLIALFFGGFQALMPLIGWFLGKGFEAYIKSVDHWVAFGLLLFIGSKMAFESFKGDEEDCCNAFDIKELFVMAIATSIDALAAGIALAMDLKGDYLLAFLTVAFIGITTFFLSAAGVKIGNIFGAKWKAKAEFAGGAILIILGLKILLEHTGILNI